ncbi:hypothetical protein GN956_G6835 [Arapaima gigas]
MPETRLDEENGIYTLLQIGWILLLTVFFNIILFVSFTWIPWDVNSLQEVESWSEKLVILSRIFISHPFNCASCTACAHSTFTKSSRSRTLRTENCTFGLNQSRKKYHRKNHPWERHI